MKCGAKKFWWAPGPVLAGHGDVEALRIHYDIAEFPAFQRTAKLLIPTAFPS